MAGVKGPSVRFAETFPMNCRGRESDGDRLVRTSGPPTIADCEAASIAALLIRQRSQMISIALEGVYEDISGNIVGEHSGARANHEATPFDGG